MISIEKVNFTNQFYPDEIFFYFRSDHRYLNDDSHRVSNFIDLALFNKVLFLEKIIDSMSVQLERTYRFDGRKNVILQDLEK